MSQCFNVNLETDLTEIAEELTLNRKVIHS